MPVTPHNAIATLSAQAFADERTVVQTLLESLSPDQDKSASAFTRAQVLVTRIREASGHGVEAFLHAYGLDTREGVAVMCLAEALLRIPDPATADRLIHGTFEHTDWGRHLDGDDSFFINASHWGLLLTGKVVNLGAMGDEKPVSLLRRLVGKAGEPVVRNALKAAMRFIGTQFVLGETVEEALAKSASAQKKGYRFSYDMLGEGARTEEQAQEYVKSYCNAIALIGKHTKAKSLMDAPSISVKLSALHPRYQLTQKERVMGELLPKLVEIVRLAKDAGISVSIDAEEASRLDIELMLYDALLREPSLAGYDGIGFVLQAYQKRAYPLVDWLAKLCRETKRRIPLRLVKGAYWDSEIKQAQLRGLPSYPVFTRKEHTDLSYMACARKILEHADVFYPQFGTHNALTASAIMEMAGGSAFEFQRLHGMGEALHDQLLHDAPCRIYVPIGKHEDLLPYLIRRLLENGANTSFVNMLMDKHTPMKELLQDPVAQLRALAGKHTAGIAEPKHLYADRDNSRGYDLGYLHMLDTLQKEAAGTQETPQIKLAKEKDVSLSMDRAIAAWPNWRATDVQARAQMLEHCADLLEANQAQALAIIIEEGRKTLVDAIAELREAVDYCRYYAVQARTLMAVPKILQGPTGESNMLSLEGRGVFACIAPWNFPLAIFLGQVAAALVTGNCVIAKPAEQTPRVAAFAVRLLHEAGVPKDVLQLLVGDGSIGAALTREERIAGVAFTGSLDTAQAINRSLAARKGPIVPLIAETGGQNCMIVDSSALLEQVTDDVVLSAFGSSGQRCSALRVLFVQEEVADKLITLIAGAMRELKLGDPRDPSVDLGPVIDADAQKTLLDHIARMKKSAKFLASTPIDTKKNGTYVAPHMFEIKSLNELPGEVFGPMLHVIRFKAQELRQVCEQINATGYGLTFGLHSRIGGQMEVVEAHIRAGNLYVNRSMIGATVGVQPFGGGGLSGTGPKAGGPHYLLRFVSERSLSVNTAAIGGNMELLAGPGEG